MYVGIGASTWLAKIISPKIATLNHDSGFPIVAIRRVRSIGLFGTWYLLK